MYINSNMTNEEVFRAFGYLPEERAEEALNAQKQLDSLDGIWGLLQDAKAFPNEDFLEEVMLDLKSLAKRLRGDNKEGLNEIIQKLEDIQNETARESEYGLDNIRQIEKLIEQTDIY